MSIKAKLLVFALFLCAAALSPCLAFANEVSVDKTLIASGGSNAALEAQSTVSYVDGGLFGSCEWYIVYDSSDDSYVLFIEPADGRAVGFLDSSYVDEDTNGSTTPWYGYSDYLTGIIVSGTVYGGYSCEALFCDCPNVTYIVLSRFDTSIVSNMRYMFYGCSSLGSIFVGRSWTMDAVEDSEYMFYGCYSLEGGDGTWFDPNYDDGFLACADLPYQYGYLTSVDLRDADIVLGSNSFTYTGSPICPSATVKIGSLVLDEGSDYGIEYEDNVNAGDLATVYVEGKGIFVGGNIEFFDIVPANIANARVTLTKTSGVYSGKAQKGSVRSVKLGSTVLIPGIDYTVSAKSGKAAGTYAVTVKGKGNYTGSAKAIYTVKKASAKTTVVKAKSFKESKLKNRAASFKAITLKTDGKIAWKVIKNTDKKHITFKAGKVTVKKGIPKGTYTLKIKVSAKAGKNYKAVAAKTYTVRIKVT